MKQAFLLPVFMGLLVRGCAMRASKQTSMSTPTVSPGYVMLYVVSEPVEKLWGQTVAYVRDQQGFLVELCSPLP